MVESKILVQLRSIAALRKRGATLAAVSREARLSSSTLANILSRPWPKGEWIIVHPSEI
ncbi:transcriptional regulator [Xenorhabdus sp. KJ12.1]|nr:transcriptional regulator [Xenorhabdus sp. KJ12.1]